MAARDEDIREPGETGIEEAPGKTGTEEHQEPVAPRLLAWPWGEEGSDDPDTQAVDWQEPAAGPVRLLVDQHGPGPVSVCGWDRDEVRVRAVKRLHGWSGERRAEELLRRVEVNVRRHGEVIEVETGYDDGWSPFWGGCRVSVAVLVAVPRGSAVDIDAGSGRVEVRETRGSVEVDSGSGGVTVKRAAGRVSVDSGSGSVEVEEVQGDVRVDLGSGSVNLSRISGRVEIDGSSGSVTVCDVAGEVSVDTSSGSVRLRRVLGDISVDTGSGSVRLESVRGRQVHVDTGSGSIEAEFDILSDGSYSFDTGSGDVILTLPEDASFTLDANTGSGPIRCSLPLAGAYSDHGHLHGVLGDGSAVIEVDTSSGGLVVRGRRGAGRGDGPGPRSSHAAHRPSGRASTEGREIILRMVAEGRLTAEQGEALLAAIEGRDTRTTGPEPPGDGPEAPGGKPEAPGGRTEPPGDTGPGHTAGEDDRGGC